MIDSFKHRGLKRFYDQGDAKKIAPDHRQKVADILTALDSAQEVEDVNLATFHLHPLTGNRKGIWPVTIRAN